MTKYDEVLDDLPLSHEGLEILNPYAQQSEEGVDVIRLPHPLVDVLTGVDDRNWVMCELVYLIYIYIS
jgi:hypothetical protein